jgi:hypothetical protein
MMLEKSDAVEGAEQGRIVVYVQQLSKNYYKSASNKTLTKFMHLSVAVKCRSEVLGRATSRSTCDAH